MAGMTRDNGLVPKMICGYCGHETSGPAARCSDCGAPLAPERPTVPDALTVMGIDPGDQPTIVPLPGDPQTGSNASGGERYPVGPSGNGSVSTDAPTLGPDAPTQHAGTSAGPPSAVTGPLAQGESFGARYHIIRLLGIGGMGAVYQAWDEVLGVAVAIKVIRPETMRDPRAAAEIERRFKRELLLARQVTHKNVVRIHDIGEINGIKYITMAFVKGTDLATRLKREGKLPVDVVMPIARAIVSGLHAAHTAGVVHRDLKPANIIINDDGGEALIMDFGIARSAGGRGLAPASDPRRPSPAVGPITRVVEATMVGVIVGTIEYMAPEQAKGMPVDQRADIYSVGLILYDALVGGYRSVGAESAIAELEGRMLKPPPAARTVSPEIPEALDRVISKCLEPDAAKRYQTTEELEADLVRLDNRGELIPIKRVVGMKMVSGIVALALALIGGVWYYARTLVPPPPHDPVSVVIADFQNRTGDASFDRTLEPALRIGLEDAGFITAFDRTQMANLGATVSADLDEAAARKIALGQGIGVVVSGSIDRQGRGYRVSFAAIQTVTGEAIASGDSSASSKDQVLTAVTQLAATLRTKLGDETSESAKVFAMDTLAATSLDVIHEYAQAMEALANGKNEEARQRAAKAAQLDPNFGSAYGIMAAASEALTQHEEANQYIRLALARLDRVTERERYRIRGLSFVLTGDQRKCVEEYGELVKRYPSDTSAHNNLSVCARLLRDMPRAIEEMRSAVAILPKRARFRSNLALNAAYGGEFQTAEREAQETLKLNPTYTSGFSALAFAQLGQGQLAEVAETYETLKNTNASQAASGLGDLALYEGRLSDAAQIYESGATADLTAREFDNAAHKFAALAYVELTRGHKDKANEAAKLAVSNSKTFKAKFLAGRILAETGDAEAARKVAADLASDSQLEPRASAKIVEGDIAVHSGQIRQGINALTEANGLLDTWIGRFDLGRAYVADGAFTQADSEFDRCLKRRGEALALFLGAEPTYGYFPHVYYYQGRVREGLGSTGSAESYLTYLKIRGKAGEDPLLAEVRKRAGQ